jgi:hypothetical protein
METNDWTQIPKEKKNQDTKDQKMQKEGKHMQYIYY